MEYNKKDWLEIKEHSENRIKEIEKDYILNLLISNFLKNKADEEIAKFPAEEIKDPDRPAGVG